MRSENLSILLLMSLLATGQAQEVSSVSDFSGGFEQLAALGLPALDKRAEWCAHPAATSNYYEFREVAKSLKGNAWLLPSADGKTRLVSMGGVAIIEADAAENNGSNGGIARKSKPAVHQDLSKDVEAIISSLEKLAAKQDDNDPFSGGYRNSNLGSMLLLAAQLHQTGHTALANRLAVAVFAVSPTREAAVDAAINKLADPICQQAAREFFASGDWAVYQKALASLVKRFPRGWANKDAVAMMLPQLEKQAAGAKAPVPSLPDIPIDPRALEIIRELTEKPPVDPKQADVAKTGNLSTTAMLYRRRMMMEGMEFGGYDRGVSSLWIVRAAPDAGEKKSTLTRLAELKMAALPALAALATDPFFTYIPNPRSSSGYYSSNENREEQILRAYSGLNRPCTRGEIARQWLAATLPDPQNELNNADSETLRDLALDFWKQYKDSSVTDLAAAFLTEGSRSQASEAANFLATSSDPKAHQVFETYVLASEQAIAYFSDVQTYLKARKAAGKPFLGSYAKLVRSQAAAGQDENEISWQIKEAGGVEKILKNLESLVGGASPSVTAVRIAKGKAEDAKSAIQSLSEMLEGSSTKKQLYAYLEGANAATDAGIRARFLDAISSISWDGKALVVDENAPLVERKVIDAEAAIWRKLLEDTREIPKGTVQGGDASTIAELAAGSFEYSVSPRHYRMTFEAAPILGKTASAILLEQATARLAGKPIPPLPDAKQVSPDRLKAIIAETGKKAPIEIHPYLQTLSPNERAAWLEWIREPGEITVPKSVESLKMLVTEKSEKSPWSYPITKDTAGMDVGFAVSPANIRTYVDTLAKNLDKHSRGYFMFGPTNFGPGLALSAIQFPIPEKKPELTDSDTDSLGDEINEPSALGYLNTSISTLKDQETAEGVIVVNVSGSHDPFVWLVEKGKAKPLDAEAWSTFDSSFENQEISRYFSIRIEILSKSDAEKITAATE